jgi:hypothetical protein
MSISTESNVHNNGYRKLVQPNLFKRARPDLAAPDMQEQALKCRPRSKNSRVDRSISRPISIGHRERIHYRSRSKICIPTINPRVLPPDILRELNNTHIR